MRKPRIAMTAWRRELPTFIGEKTDLYTLGVEYTNWISEAGGIPIILGHLSPEDATDALIGVDGLVLTGGGDISPEVYGQTNHGESHGVSNTADASELALARGAQAAGIPTLGICRGLQIANVALGGTLQQDVTDPNGIHKPNSDVPQEVMDERHSLRIKPGSTMAEIYGESRSSVNTIHHQAINELAPGLVATAWAPDDIIEAAEAAGDWSYVGVQWHPEKMPGEDESVLFTHFLDTVRTAMTG